MFVGPVAVVSVAMGFCYCLHFPDSQEAGGEEEKEEGKIKRERECVTVLGRPTFFISTFMCWNAKFSQAINAIIFGKYIPVSIYLYLSTSIPPHTHIYIHVHTFNRSLTHSYR